MRPADRSRRAQGRQPWVCLLALVALAAPTALQGEVGQRHPVRARLVADVGAVRPGDAFAVGVVLDMAPGWHTYWAFPGDAGLATKVEWQVPAGFASGPLEWPAPHRYLEAGDLTAFGYADQVLLAAQMRAPQALPDTVAIGARVSWLVCREICIPGDTTLALTFLPGGIPSAASLFARYRWQVPTDLVPTDPISWTSRVRAEGDGALAVAVEIRAGAADAELPDFFPRDAGAAAYIETGRRLVDPGGAVRSEARVVPYDGGLRPTHLAGVIAFADAGGRRQVRSVTVDLSAPAPAIDLRRADFTAAGGAGGRGLWLYLLLAAVGGLILNLMPCVLPVISLKVMSLVSQAGASAVQVRRLGLAFSAGVVATFLLLAAVVVAVRAGGEQVGWGFQFQSPAFVLFLAGLVFVLALSLFGVVALRLPGVGGSLGGLADAEGAGGSFANGVLATVLATPCTAPFLGSALGFAFAQPAATTLSVFAAAGAGMALPYALLAWHPGWLRFLPRPGAWMERFKQGMGFLLLATVVWLLWILGRQLGMEAVVWTAAFLLCLALGVWVLGTWVDLASSGRARACAWAVAAALTAAGYALFLRPLLAAPAPAGGGVPSARWQAFSVDGVEALLDSGRPVFVDFTADWCWTCKVNERTVLSDPEVVARFDALGVALVKADWTSRDPDITRLLQSFGRSGVPLYVLFPEGRADAPLVLPEVITTGIVLDRLERAADLARR